MNVQATVDQAAPLSEPPSDSRVEIHVRGKNSVVSAIELEHRDVVVTGRWIRTAWVRDEELIEGFTLTDPESFIARLRAGGLKADIFTFTQRVPQTERIFHYPTEWENAATLTITTFENWWRQAEYSIRKAVSRSKKCGVTVRTVPFDDELVNGICRIYNETPVRQGKPFWHYKKSFQQVKNDLATYLNRSVFLGAYFGGELIGSMKITFVGPAASIMQILALSRHFDKRPNNALIAKAVEVCEEMGKKYLVYGSFVYHDPSSTLTEFKRRNGFESVPLPRYFMPLSQRGRLIIRLGLHRAIQAMLPKPLLRLLLKVRKLWAERILDRKK